jgi:type I restriction enzyme S subunit
LTSDLPDYSRLATIVSKTPSVCWIQPELVDTGRLDVDFYRGDYIAALQAIVTASTCQIRSIGEISQRVFNFGAYSLCNLIEFVEPDATTVPFLNVGDIDDLVVRVEDAKHIQSAIHLQLPKSQCKPGDVLLTMAGTIGKTVVVPSTVTELNSNQAIAKIRLHDEYDPYFLAAFFSSSHGRAQSERMSAGAVQKNLYLFNIESMFVPLPPRPVQEYIGAKVRLAERCRTRARELRQEAHRCLDAGVGIDIQAATQITEGKRFRALAVQPEIVSVDSMLVSRRLDSAAYSPVRLALLDLLEDARCEFLSIETVADDVTKQRRRYKRDKYAASYFVSILHLNNKGTVDFHEAKLHNPVSSGIVCQIGDILFSGINPSQNRVTVWTKEGRALCSAEFSIYRPRKDISPFYLAFVWRSVYCLNQLEALTRGTSSSRRRLKEEDFAELLVPVLTPDDQALIARNEQQAVEMDARAAEFVHEAKADVEALIEGRLDVEGIVAGRVQPPTWEDVEA